MLNYFINIIWLSNIVIPTLFREKVSPSWPLYMSSYTISFRTLRLTHMVAPFPNKCVKLELNTSFIRVKPSGIGSWFLVGFGMLVFVSFGKLVFSVFKVGIFTNLVKTELNTEKTHLLHKCGLW